MMRNIFFHGQSRSVEFATLLVLILVFAAFFRLLFLGSIPQGMTWDEAAIGYNGYAVITTRRDEWLQKLPVSFQSFGDYKAPAAIYLDGLFTTALGMSLLAVRLPFALFGIGAVAAFGWVVYELADKKNKQWQTLVGMLLMATVPWHVHYSRIGFESGIALSMFLIGLGSLLYIMTRGKSAGFTKKILFLGLTTCCWVASVYTYHSAKLFLPLFLMWLAWIERDWIKSSWKWVGAMSLIGLSLLTPLFRDSIWGPGATRADVLITNQGLSLTQTGWLFVKNLAAHLNPQFLVLGQTESLRHGSGAWGVLSPVSFLMMLVGLVSLAVKFVRRAKLTKLALFGIVIIVFGLIPAALSSEAVPHSNRALFALPGMLLVVLVGIKWSIELITTKLTEQIAFRVIVGMVILLELLCFFAYWHDYTHRFARECAADFQDGYLEAMDYAIKYEKGLDGYPQVDKLVITDVYGQPYIFTLFVRRTSPIAYRGGSLYKYEFVPSISESDLLRNNALIISTPQDGLNLDQADHVVYGSDGQVRFVINYTGIHE